ncbi:MAG: hypothetical protein Kow0074_21040 [Candidatus Zixiibacteriota bacterium]
MRRVRYNCFPIIPAVALTVLLLGAGCAESESVSQMPETGPVITGDRNSIDSLLSANKGRWVMLNVWATWCRPCVAETPDLVAFANKMAGRPFTMIGLSTDYFTVDDTTAVRKVREFQSKYNVPYTNMVFLGGTSELTEHLDLSGVLPTTILFDPSGEVAEQYIGLIDHAELDQLARRINGT